MTKKNIMPACIAIAAIATFVGNKTLKPYADESKKLLMQNIEALSQDENNPCIQNSECHGPCTYANVGQCKGKTYSVTHFCDSIDVRIEYSYEACYADGHGIMEGSNMMYNIMQEGQTYTKCQGERGHVSIPSI